MPRSGRHRLQLAAAAGAVLAAGAVMVTVPAAENPALAGSTTSAEVAGPGLTPADLADLLADRTAEQAQGSSRSQVRIPAAGTAPKPPPASASAAASPPPPQAPAPAAPRAPREIARALVTDRSWDSAQFTCLDKLWQKESRWDPRAENPSSGAYGIPQALPAGRMATAGPDWRTDVSTQVEWGLNYIDERYGTPCAAWRHSQRLNWY